MNQKGIAQLALLFFLILGIGIGTYIVQNRTNFLPRADCNPGIDNNCDTGGGSEDEEQAEKEAAQKEEQQNLEKGAREAGKSVEEYKIDDCKANPGKPGCSEILKKASTTSDGQSFDSQSDATKKMFSKAYCGGNETANCQAAKDQWAKEHAVEAAKGGKELTEEERQKQQEEAANRNKATLDASRKSLDPDGKIIADPNGYINNCAEAEKEACRQKVEVLKEIIKAQEAHDYAVTTKFDNPVTQDAAYTQAKLLARVANCDAVAADIRGSNCVLDMGDTTNIQKATVKGQTVRVFLGCSTTDSSNDPETKGSCRKILNYRPDNCSIQNDNLTKPECRPQELPADVAAKFVNPGVDPKKMYKITDLTSETLKSGVDYCQSTGRACILAGQAPPGQSTELAKQAKDAGNQSVNAEICRTSIKVNSGKKENCVINGTQIGSGDSTRADKELVCQLHDTRYGANNAMINSIKERIDAAGKPNNAGHSGCDDDQLVKWWCDGIEGKGGIGKKDCEIKKAECIESEVCKGSSTTQTDTSTGQINRPPFNPFDPSTGCNDTDRKCTGLGEYCASAPGPGKARKCETRP